ncbi:hypothetical protein PCYB_011020 [Plasmodium cynomolgi strain B]|uniref:Uncharacterized protein n=1 Tax=Plasmodium cynomolgi (strain B) TaxID=1120755 RepID=K6UP77_PLACD|nr:hypothetical protein PCYB_011020 [Plasmodium cynomolgi strain B]GAB64369.1 hypothetical protein PCYB_011020 [Plasmodium cynomolgi strain B]
MLPIYENYTDRIILPHRIFLLLYNFRILKMLPLHSENSSISAHYAVQEEPSEEKFFNDVSNTSNINSLEQSWRQRQRQRKRQKKKASTVHSI